MPTQRQLAANRRNAKKCTGPRTSEGKARSSRNNLKHGLYSRAAVLPNENPAARAQLETEYRDTCNPLSDHHIPLIDKLTESEWLLRRYSAIEATIWNQQPDPSVAFETVGSTLCRVERYRNHAAKEFRSALHELGNPGISTTQNPPEQALNPELVSSRSFTTHRI